MAHPKKDRAKLKKRPHPRRGLDDRSLDEYLIQELEYVMFKREADSPPFQPQQADSYQFLSTNLTVPAGMKRIYKEEIYGQRPSGKAPFGGALAKPPSPTEPFLLHILYEFSTAAAPPVAGDLVQTTEDYCNLNAPDGPLPQTHGTLYPCARALRTTSDPGRDDFSVFVEWDWAAHYYLRDPTQPESPTNPVTPTGAGLRNLFGGKAPVRMVAMVIPDRTVVWVPFATNAGGGDEKFAAAKIYAFENVIFVDKPSIWMTSKFRFSL